MKKFLSLLAALTVASFTSAAFAADTTTIWLTKTSNENVAKVCTAKSCLGNVPVSYVDGATWATAKDSYDVSPATLAALESKSASITVHGDGGISVSSSAPKASKSKKEASKK